MPHMSTVGCKPAAKYVRRGECIIDSTKSRRKAAAEIGFVNASDLQPLSV